MLIAEPCNGRDDSSGHPKSRPNLSAFNEPNRTVRDRRFDKLRLPFSAAAPSVRPLSPSCIPVRMSAVAASQMTSGLATDSPAVLPARASPALHGTTTPASAGRDNGVAAAGVGAGPLNVLIDVQEVRLVRSDAAVNSRWRATGGAPLPTAAVSGPAIRAAPAGTWVAERAVAGGASVAAWCACAGAAGGPAAGAEAAALSPRLRRDGRLQSKRLQILPVILPAPTLPGS